MREFAFGVAYQRGVDPLMDEFVECPGLAADSMEVPLGPDAFCRIERFTGPRSVLDDVERLRTDPAYESASFGETACDATADHHVLERDRSGVWSTPTSRGSRAVLPPTPSPGSASTRA
ncbi:hypothetical protein BRC93_14425, partial [Halobacteriales archaeon QS_5_70_15]